MYTAEQRQRDDMMQASVDARIRTTGKIRLTGEAQDGPDSTRLEIGYTHLFSKFFAMSHQC